MRSLYQIISIFCCFFLGFCSGDNEIRNYPQPQQQNPTTETTATFKYLALGDSYTIGQSVCETCRFPEQLKVRLHSDIPNAMVNLQIIAQTGWTTTNLKNAINASNLATDFDLVTLLIGVNNQYQNKPFSLYEQEFPELLVKAIVLAKGNPANVIVVSIPDYRYTPYGNGLQNPETVSQQIDQYNAFAHDYCQQQNITFVDITGITRLGLENPSLVAQDGLHPSETAYSQFVVRIAPVAKSKLMD